MPRQIGQTVKRALLVVFLALTATAYTPDQAPTTTPFAITTPLQSSTSAIPSYHRAEFGNGWVIVRGHCDTREVVLERDAAPAAVDTDGDGCKDDAPVLDPYTDQLVDPPHADADHIVALQDAWVSGAWQWTPAQRRAFANDQDNLRAVGASINRSKGELSADRWRPPARSGWCFYAASYEATKQRWHLTITPAQSAAVNDMLKTCPGSAR
jgi:hypothetical protein